MVEDLADVTVVEGFFDDDVLFWESERSRDEENPGGLRLLGSDIEVWSSEETRKPSFRCKQYNHVFSDCICIRLQD